MRARQGVRGGCLIAVGVGCFLMAASAHGATTTDRPGSILMFPKVVRDGTRDTIIQITNTGNSTNQVHCFYLDGQPGRNGAPLCSVVDFDIALTRQQPTHWQAGAGRRVDPTDQFGSPGAGFDPGFVPPIPVGFTGALICYEDDGSGGPVFQNKLKGEATLVSPNGDESKYNAIQITATSPVAPLNQLDLNATEYAQCPSTLRFNFIADGGIDPAVQAYGNQNSTAVTNLTLIPCNLDFRNGVRATGTLQVAAYDEFEVLFTGSTPLACWQSFNIGEIQAMRSVLQPGGSLGTFFANAVLSPSTPFVGIAETFHADGTNNVGSSSVNLHTSGGANSTILLP